MDTERDLEEALSRPIPADCAAMAKLPGDLMILGVAGKMGPSLAVLARRAAQQAGIDKRIFGVARFSAAGSRRALDENGIETIPCDLFDRQAVDRLPDCPNVVFMAGHKFGSAENQPLTWATNTLLPAIVAEQFRSSRIVAFSTGNVYPFVPVAGGGASESDPVGPVGEYAQSVLGRERILEYLSQQHQTPMAILRLNYAVELRYGVLRDIADRVFQRRPIDLTMGSVNVIWQRDATSVALRSFDLCSAPPAILNVTGTEVISVRSLAQRFGAIWGIEPILEGSEAETALLSDASRCRQLFGPPQVSLDEMVRWVAAWVQKGGRSLGKPTHYEERAGAF